MLAFFLPPILHFFTKIGFYPKLRLGIVALEKTLEKFSQLKQGSTAAEPAFEKKTWRGQKWWNGRKVSLKNKTIQALD